MCRFLVIIEEVNRNYSAYSPDLPGQKVEQNMHEAIEIHARGRLEDNLPIPESQVVSRYEVLLAMALGFILGGLVLLVTGGVLAQVPSDIILLALATLAALAIWEW